MIVVSCENREKAGPYLSALGAVGVREEEIDLLVPHEPVGDATERAAAADGVVLCGGPDLDPRHYGEEPRDDADLFVDPPVDELDLAVLRGAARAQVPLWAICRGLQLLNVHLGGTLWQDVYRQVPGVVDHSVPAPPETLAHRIEVTRPAHPGATPYLGPALQVNSRHHQAIREPAPELVALAHAPDGLVEVATVDRPGWWVQAVQWHPENLVDLPRHRALWERFVEAAGRRGGARAGAGRPAGSEPPDAGGGTSRATASGGPP